jgi:hypothetical protein
MKNTEWKLPDLEKKILKNLKPIVNSIKCLVDSEEMKLNRSTLKGFFISKLQYYFYHNSSWNEL